MVIKISDYCSYMYDSTIIILQCFQSLYGLNMCTYYSTTYLHTRKLQ